MYSSFVVGRTPQHGDRGVSGYALSIVPLRPLTLRVYRPMSLVSSIFGSDDDTEILDALYTIANASQILSSSVTAD